MTSVATIFGAVPIALGFGSSSRAPLGVAVVSGMATATLLTLYVTPVIYATLADAVDRLRGKRGVAVAAATVGALLLAPRAHGEELGLGRALAIAKEHNLDLAEAGAVRDQAHAGEAAARAVVLPSVSATGSIEYGVGQFTGAAPIWSGQGLGHLGVPLIEPSGWAAIGAARTRADAADQATVAALEQVLSDAGARYVALARAQQAVAEAEALVARSGRLLELARDRVTVGSGAPIEQTRAEVQARQDELRLVQARNDLETARLQLVEYLGLPLDADLAAVAGPVATAPAGDPTRPDLAAAELATEAATLDRRSAALGVLPTVEAYADGGVLRTAETHPIASVGVEATVPLLTGTARRSQVDLLDAVAAQRGLEQQDLEREVSVQVKVADANVATGEQAWALAKEARRLAEQEVALAEDRFATGASSNVEVVEAQARLSTATTGEVDALAAYNLALIEAWRARGRLAELIAN
jgi:cobalt-zinc-cadmium efflux system outer membrane protein